MMTARERTIFKIRPRAKRHHRRLKLDTTIFLLLLVLAIPTSAPMIVRLSQVFGEPGVLKNDYYCSLIKEGSSTVDMPRTELVRLCAEWGVDLTS